MKTISIRTISALLGSLGLGLAACGGGSGNAPTLGSPTVLLGAAVYFDSLGGLFAVKPESPVSPATLDTGVIFATALPSATYNAITKQFVDARSRFLIYAKGGQIFKSEMTSSVAFSAVRVSSEATLTETCDEAFILAHDWADANNSIILYTVPGATPGCGDGDEVTRLVRPGMGSSTAPLNLGAKRAVAATREATNGALSGVLMQNGGVLERCNTNLDGCTSVRSGTTFVLQVGTYFSPAGAWMVLLNIDNELYAFDSTIGTLSAKLYDFLGTPRATVADTNATYFADQGRVVKLDYNGPMATPLTTDTNPIEQMALTTDRIVYLAGSRFVLKALSKAGGLPVPLVTKTVSTDNMSLLATAGNRIYYNFRNNAGHITDTGSGSVEIAGSSWLGAALPTTFAFNRNRLHYPQSNALTPWAQYGTAARVVRADGCTALSCAGATLKSLVATSHSGELTLGTLPADIPDFSLNLLGSVGQITGIAATQTDLFYIDVDGAGSLLRLTNTTDRSESRVETLF